MHLLQSAQETSCEGCNQMQRQIAQLERQLLKAKAEKDEAVRLKEEVIQCYTVITVEPL